MGDRGGREGGYVVPSYRAPHDAPWYHFLHGNVPGHQIDFIYRPEVPEGPLTRQHFSHLARLMEGIEPPANSPCAFAIGNLSRDDTQHEPGHGGVALLFGLRIRGAVDHAGRRDPPFTHAIAAIDRQLDSATLVASASAFHRRVLGPTGPSVWYPAYARRAAAGPSAARRTLEEYVKSFEDLPQPKPSRMGFRWTSGGAALPGRVVIVHGDDASFEVIARCAARIVAMLYQSDLRWTSISNGREADVPDGVSIRLVAQRDLVLDAAEKVYGIDEIPEEEAEIAQRIFDAQAAAPEERPAAPGWRGRCADKGVPSKGDASAEPPVAPVSVADLAGSRESGAGTPIPVRMLDGQPTTLESDPPGHHPVAPARFRWFVACVGLAGAAVITAAFYAARPDHKAPSPAPAAANIEPAPANPATEARQEAPARQGEDARDGREPPPAARVSSSAVASTAPPVKTFKGTKVVTKRTDNAARTTAPDSAVFGNPNFAPATPR